MSIPRRSRRAAGITGICCLAVLATASVAPPAGAASSYRCRNITHMKKHFAYGWLHYQARFCYSRSKQRVVYGGVNRTWVERNKAGWLVDFGISSQDAGNYKVMSGRAIYDLSTVQVCNYAGLCIHATTTFKVLALWDGGYLWRVGKTTGQVSGPP
jgi:hypothetical protein